VRELVEVACAAGIVVKSHEDHEGSEEHEGAEWEAQPRFVSFAAFVIFV
jgi:hypothetical protein